ncbi:hypothetical protein OF83DRAFT_1162808 [Amylostereum chailletii]|nr:hypothetical protein OF83DRAFT_1162808 [Amylostereum chailletii]
MENERSTSRGREFHSSGRGGVGNIRQASLSRDRAAFDGPDDFSVTRGREPHPAHIQHDTGNAVSTGRGGAGNFRSRSRPRDSVDSTFDRDLIQSIDQANDTGVHSTGRGGIGNIARSKSRSRSRGPVLTTGRGGIGNMKSGEPTEVTIHEVEDQERLAHMLPHGIHSTGRGGMANMTSDIEPPLNEPTHPHASHSHEFQSTGRGGVGNIRSRSGSREPGQNGPTGGHERHGISALFHRGGGGSRPSQEVEAGVVDKAK